MADQVKAIFAPKVALAVHKDKLEQTKIRERELKEAHRLELANAKKANEERRSFEHTQFKEERAFHDTKRSARDRREAAKREAHAETDNARECEHGVWRCKICFPHKVGKERLV
ncbi:hypothetical protein NADE_000755 [Nannochloris sp. 'desiccata']|nr:hypothetical protein KSW81_003732 [Chlorella desiccata (nom. nud.)]KAH7615918.1 hypothetical protein NADE_000755 [Chlorella desiccata (nom. nud.)]